MIKDESVAPTDPEILMKSVKLGTMKQMAVTLTIIKVLISQHLMY